MTETVLHFLSQVADWACLVQSLYAIEGSVGAGKSYIATNREMRRWLEESDRPIYTNLPINVEEFLCYCSRSPVTRDKYRRRLHFLHDIEREVFDRKLVKPVGLEEHPGGPVKWEEVPWPETVEEMKELRENGCRIELINIGKRNMLAEFWYFCKPNAVIFLDELADIYPAVVEKDEKQIGPDGKPLPQKRVYNRQTLRSYINHHRHYKDDLYFFMQNREDVDVQVRRKILYVYYVENMKYRNMFDWWALKGLRWPVQWFRVRIYQGRKVLGKGGDFDVFESIDRYGMFPTRRGFKNYRSFSAAVGLAGKRKVASADAKSTDLDTVWSRVRSWLAGAWAPLSVLGFIVAAIVAGIRFMYALAGVSSDSINPYFSKSSHTNRVAAAHSTTNSAAATNVISSAIETNKPERERAVLWCPAFVRTTERLLRPGDYYENKQVKSIGPSWIIFNDGTSVRRSRLGW